SNAQRNSHDAQQKDVKDLLAGLQSLPFTLQVICIDLGDFTRETHNGFTARENLAGKKNPATPRFFFRGPLENRVERVPVGLDLLLKAAEIRAVGSRYSQ